MSAANRSAGRIIQNAVLLTNGVPNANFYSILVEIIPISDGDCFLRDEAKAAPRIKGITAPARQLLHSYQWYIGCWEPYYDRSGWSETG